MSKTYRLRLTARTWTEISEEQFDKACERARHFIRHYKMTADDATELVAHQLRLEYYGRKHLEQE